MHMKQVHHYIQAGNNFFLIGTFSFDYSRIESDIVKCKTKIFKTNYKCTF